MSGAPLFAAEVRSEEDYGPAAEKAMAAKRADRFAAGTLTVHRRGQAAETGPALPGWIFPVDELFE
jgi:hypothetical protein